MDTSTKSDDEYLDSLSDAASSDGWQELSKSEYAKVIFCDRYYDPTNGCVGCKFQITDNVHEDPCDFVGLYKVGYENLDQCLASKMLSKTQCEEDGKLLRCVFQPEDLLIVDNGFYQFLYVTRDKEVCGASMPFEVKPFVPALVASNDEVITEKADNDFLMVRYGLEKKNEDLENQLLEQQNQIKALSQELKKLTEENERIIKENGKVVDEKNKCVEEKETTMKGIDKIIKRKEKIIKEKENIIDGKEKIIKEKDHIIEDKESTIGSLQAYAADLSNMHMMKMTQGEKLVEELRKEYEALIRDEERKLSQLSEQNQCLQSNVSSLSQRLNNQENVFEAQVNYERGIVREMQDSKHMIRALEDSKKLAMKEVKDLSELLAESNKALAKQKTDYFELQDKVKKITKAHDQMKQNILKENSEKQLLCNNFDGILKSQMEDELNKLKKSVNELRCENIALKVNLKDNNIDWLRKQICKLSCQNQALKAKIGDEVKTTRYIQEYEDATNKIVGSKFSECQKDYFKTYEILKRLEIILHVVLNYLPKEYRSQVCVTVMKAKEVSNDFVFASPYPLGDDQGPKSMDELNILLNQEENFSNKCLIMWNYFKHKQFVLSVPDNIEATEVSNIQENSAQTCENAREVYIATHEEIMTWLTDLEHMTDKLNDDGKMLISTMEKKMADRIMELGIDSSCENFLTDITEDINEIDKISTIIANHVADSIKEKNVNVENAQVSLETFMTIIRMICKATYESQYFLNTTLTTQKKLLDVQEKCAQKQALTLNSGDAEKFIDKGTLKEHSCEFRDRLMEARELYKNQYLKLSKLKKKLKKQKEISVVAGTTGDISSVIPNTSSCSKNDSDTGESLISLSDTKDLQLQKPMSDLSSEDFLNNHNDLLLNINEVTNMPSAGSCREYLDAYAQMHNIPINYSTLRLQNMQDQPYQTSLSLGKDTFFSLPAKMKEEAEEDAAGSAVKHILQSKVLYEFSVQSKKSNESDKNKNETSPKSAVDVFEESGCSAVTSVIQAEPHANEESEEKSSLSPVEAPIPPAAEVETAQKAGLTATNESESTDGCFLNCSVCNEPVSVSDKSLNMLVDHFENVHSMRMCPVCGQLFDSSFPTRFIEFHVETHFKLS